MTDEEVYLKAIEIAEKAHKGQFRNDGVTPYIQHPLLLASQFKHPLDKAIAVLHDVLEDGKENGVDFNYIIYSGLPFFPVVRGLIILTHRDDETYTEYIKNISESKYVKFKIMDIMINLSDAPTEKQKKKYFKAMRILGKCDEPV